MPSSRLPALRRRLVVCLAMVAWPGLFAGCGRAADRAPEPAAEASEPTTPDLKTTDLETTDLETTDPKTPAVRVATFNVIELSADKLDVVDEGGRGAHPQLQAVAAILQRVRPDVLLLNEIDFNAERDLPRLFIERYLQTPQPLGGAPLDYPHVVYEPVNTGVASGLDLDDDGATDGPGDAWGFGRYPGQYGMALLSRFPIERPALRTFRLLPWRALPGHRMPDGADGRPAWYQPEAAAVLRLSSKSHWDVPIRIGGDDGWTLHVLASHPTPPVFDGPEDRNGRRNADEIRFWVDYLDAAPRADDVSAVASDSASDSASAIVDDQGRRGGLAPQESFVVVGDLNADPLTEAAEHGAIARLLEHPRLHDVVPRASGEPPPAALDYPGDDRTRTSAYGRIDYVLPSRDLVAGAGGVFMPPADDPMRALVESASDHSLVWVDLARSEPGPDS